MEAKRHVRQNSSKRSNALAGSHASQSQRRTQDKAGCSKAFNSSDALTSACSTESLVVAVMHTGEDT